MKPCCDKAARGLVCEHLRDALLAGIERMRSKAVPVNEARRRIVEALVLVAGEADDYDDETSRRIWIPPFDAGLDDA